jgi:hypothetical protein
MDFDLIARARLLAVTTRFATSADRGEAMKALHLLTDTFRIGHDGDLKPKGALANVLMVRQVSEYQTRHHIAQPTMTEMTPERIAGVVPIVSYKVEEGRMTTSVSDFHVTIVPVGDEWKIDRLRMIPFAVGPTVEMAPLPGAGR